MHIHISVCERVQTAIVEFVEEAATFAFAK